MKIHNCELVGKIHSQHDWSNHDNSNGSEEDFEKSMSKEWKKERTDDSCLKFRVFAEKNLSDYEKAMRASSREPPITIMYEICTKNLLWKYM